MSTPEYYPMYDTAHERRMDQARALMDSSQASELPMNFDTAFTHVTIVDNARQLPIISSPELGLDSISTMPPDMFFYTVESIDAILTSGDEESRYQAGLLAADMYRALPYLQGASMGTLANLLHLSHDPELPIFAQLASRMRPGGTDEELIATREELEQNTRIPEASY